MPKDREILIQEFIPEIKTAGEISLIFFNKEFSHAIRKTAYRFAEAVGKMS